MLLKNVIYASKTAVTEAVWYQEKPQRRSFPLSCLSGGCCPVTRKWRWAVVAFDAVDGHLRLMIACHVEVPKFQMALARP